ncbi:MAG: hypothetical protein AB7U41_03380 [Dongiaceae bacterium]
MQKDFLKICQETAARSDASQLSFLISWAMRQENAVAAVLGDRAAQSLRDAITVFLAAQLSVSALKPSHPPAVHRRALRALSR